MRGSCFAAIGAGEPMHVGVAISPSVEPVSPAAWAAVEGRAGTFVDDVRSLPTDTLWLTNFPRSTAWRYGMHRHRHLRAEGYLATRLSELISELGLRPARFGHPEAASFAAELCGRVVRRLQNGFRTSGDATSMSLDLCAALNLKASGIPETHYYLFRESAERTRIAGGACLVLDATVSWVSARRNRLQHAREVVGWRLPADTPWVLERTRRSDRGDAWLEAVDDPFFVRCRVDAVQAALGTLALHERSADGAVWLTDDEWRAYRRVAAIDVDAVLRGRWDTSLPGMVAGMLDGELSPLSLTCGLAAEQVWISLADRRAYAGEEQRFAAAAAWMRGRDRVAMLRAAMALRDRGIAVAAYGAGSVQCAASTVNRERVVDALVEIGLQAPVGWAQPGRAPHS